VTFVCVSSKNFESYKSDLALLDKLYFPHSWSLKDWDNLFGSSVNYKIYLLVEGSKIISFTLFSVDLEERFSHLMKILVRPDHANLGLGSSILEKSIEALYIEGIKSTYLEVSTKNHSAVKLYRNLNFEELCVKKRFYSCGDDAFAMQRINE
jgi:ribosomal-protein-alanine N-acetyltransferase